MIDHFRVNHDAALADGTQWRCDLQVGRGCLTTWHDTQAEAEAYKAKLERANVYARAVVWPWVPTEAAHEAAVASNHWARDLLPQPPAANGSTGVVA